MPASLAPGPRCACRHAEYHGRDPQRAPTGTQLARRGHDPIAEARHVRITPACLDGTHARRSGCGRPGIRPAATWRRGPPAPGDCAALDLFRSHDPVSRNGCIQPRGTHDPGARRRTGAAAPGHRARAPRPGCGQRRPLRWQGHSHGWRNPARPLRTPGAGHLCHPAAGALQTAMRAGRRRASRTSCCKHAHARPWRAHTQAGAGMQSSKMPAGWFPWNKP